MADDPRSRGELQTASAAEVAIKTRLQKAMPKLLEALPDDRNRRRMQRIVAMQFTRESGLYRCTISSILGCVLATAELNLEPGVGGQCWYLPFRDRRKGQTLATFVPGYLGYKDLAWRSGRVLSFNAEVVHKNDAFQYSRQFGPGEAPSISHTPWWQISEEKGPGERVAAYMAVQIEGGGWVIHVCPRIEIQKVDTGKNVWVTNPDAMWAKTAVRRGFKMLPWSPDMMTAHDLDTAQELQKQDLSVDPRDFGLSEGEVEDLEGEASEEPRDVTPQ